MLNHIEYIKKTAKSLYYKHRRIIRNLRLTLGDYESCATIGLAKALKNFNHKKGSKLEAYAYKYIKQEIKIELDKMMSQNSSERHYGENICIIKQPKTARPAFMSYGTIVKTFDDILDKREKEILYLAFCKDKSSYKIAQRLNMTASLTGIIYRRSLKKLEAAIGQYGEINNIDDIKSNLAKAYGMKKAKEYVKEAEDELSGNRTQV